MERQIGKKYIFQKSIVFLWNLWNKWMIVSNNNFVTSYKQFALNTLVALFQLVCEDNSLGLEDHQLVSHLVLKFGKFMYFVVAGLLNYLKQIGISGWSPAFCFDTINIEIFLAQWDLDIGDRLIKKLFII